MSIKIHLFFGIMPLGITQNIVSLKLKMILDLYYIF